MPDLFAIDPGYERSAVVALACNNQRVLGGVVLPNAEVAPWIIAEMFAGDSVAIEMVASYGMPVGREVFDTCVWIGRFFEALSHQAHIRLITRAEVKLHLCGQTRGVNDAVLRQRLIDRYGPGKPAAIGTKKYPGPLYGIKGDMWQALALGIAACETNARWNENPHVEIEFGVFDESARAAKGG